MTPSLDTLSALLDDPRLFDEGVEAARNACVAGAPLAAAAITAAAYYDNPLTGGRALRTLIDRLSDAPLVLETWLTLLSPAPHPETGDPMFVPGFGYLSDQSGEAVLEVARAFQQRTRGARLGFYLTHARVLGAKAGALNVCGLCALVALDAGWDADSAERNYLLVRLAPALKAAQRAKQGGLARFPFFENGYGYEGAWPEVRVSEPCSELELDVLKKAVGLG